MVKLQLDSPEDQSAAGSVVRLPGIREDATPTSLTPSATTPATERSGAAESTCTGISLIGAPARGALHAPTAPRIDISRASSSSHHDSRDSTPDRDAATAKLALGFREEGTLELRSSTEELDFQEQQQQPEKARKGSKARPQSPSVHDDAAAAAQRKDSQSSELGLLLISGRTSRLSSIGSAGSNQSRLSNASRLSVVSGQSGVSRSPSPHKMLLETSFCGPKSQRVEALDQQEGTKIELLEKVLLSRKSDPTEAVMAEGISVDTSPTERKSPIDRAGPSPSVEEQSKRVQSVKSDITIKVDEPQSSGEGNNNASKPPPPPRRIVSKSGVEYIYIPLKGPLPADDETDRTKPERAHTKPKLRQVKSATVQSKTSIGKDNVDVGNCKPRSKSAVPSPVLQKRAGEPKYIRIKLKPDYMYSDEKDEPPPSTSSASVLQDHQHLQQKPESLDLDGEKMNRIAQQKAPTVDQEKVGKLATPTASPRPARHAAIKEIANKTPSPSLSRRSSFASLFRSKEAIIISPESPTMPNTKRKNTLTNIFREASDIVKDKNRSRSRSKSRERDKSTISSGAPSSSESIDSKSKHKSIFSIFKSTRRESKPDIETTHDMLPNLEGIAKVEFMFNDNNVQRQCEKLLHSTDINVRIPLHSPTYYESCSILQELKTSSQDSQDTVIETACISKNVEAVVEVIPREIQSNIKCGECEKEPPHPIRQSSSSSENIVFTTKLGSNNEIFTTKLPKKQNNIVSSSIIQNSDVIEVPIKNEEEPLKSTIEQLPTPPENVKMSEPPPPTEPRIVECVVKKQSELVSNQRHSTIISSTTAGEEEAHFSSESERDSESDTVRSSKRNMELKLDVEMEGEVERKGLVLQQDSYDEELPYVPTTLPQERSAAVPIVPIKQRTTFEMKTCPIERPRSTTPINPGCLEEYCEEIMGGFNSDNITKTIEKLRISLPRHDSMDKPMKSPRKTTGNWFEFAEKGLHTGRRASQQEGDAPPLPPKGVQKEWINFEEIPERRKPPKRIQTLPSRGHIDIPDGLLHDNNVVYNYVNPEECKCECHELSAREREKKQPMEEGERVQEDELPLLEDEVAEEEKVVVETESVMNLRLDGTASDRRNVVVSDSSVNLS